MPRELVSLMVGQCGVQLGARFWEMAVAEHAGVPYDDAASSFFAWEGAAPPERGQAVDARRLRARALLVDMEEGVLSQVMRGPQRHLFGATQFVRSVSGSGNNWAQGFAGYGPEYDAQLREGVRRLVERCESPQAFFVLHSLGGGTGSGLGTYLLELLADEFAETTRFVAAVCPSANDDVVTSPYNSTLALAKLIEHADCVLPLDNQALLDAVAAGRRARGEKPAAAADDAKREDKRRAYDEMNDLAAAALCDLTSSVRFEGALNVDLSDIAVNLVPFPSLHFLVPAVAPLPAPLLAQPRPPPSQLPPAPRALELLQRVTRDENQLIKVRLSQHAHLACAFLGRGDLSITEVNAALGRVGGALHVPFWNRDSFKIGLCSVPPARAGTSMLSLVNSTAIVDCFAEISARFERLFRRRAHLHHYTALVPEDAVAAAAEAVADCCAEYVRVLKLAPGDVALPPRVAS